jgi:protein gp37
MARTKIEWTESTWNPITGCTKISAGCKNCYDKEGYLEWTHNIWMGVTVEDNTVTKRIDLLRQTGAKIKFLSCEPLLTEIPGMNLTGIDWVIVGGESGRTPRPVKEEWVLDIKDQCQNGNVAFYFKQWGGTNKKKNGKSLQGRHYTEMPEINKFV